MEAKKKTKKTLLMKRHEKERMNSANVYLNNSSGKNVLWTDEKNRIFWQCTLTLFTDGKMNFIRKGAPYQQLSMTEAS